MPSHSTASSTTPPADAPSSSPVRSKVIGDGVRWMATWGLRVGIVLVALWLVMQALKPLWEGILPIIIGLILATVLWPPTAWLRRRGLPPAGAAATSLLLGIGVVGGLLTAVVTAVAAKAPELADQANGGLSKIQTWLQGPPFNIKPDQMSQAFETLTTKLKSSGSTIANGVFTGATSVTHALVTAVIALILCFFFIKDGPTFIPWVRRTLGSGPGSHVVEVLTRMWKVLGGYVRAQAAVSAVDAFFIGIGLWILGVPLALPLAVLTFLGGFIPIVGATVAGILAVLVALVTVGPTKALIALAIVLAVQQIEGHVLQPVLQGRTMQLHPALVLLSVAVGSQMAGIVGAFLAVPATALLVVLLRYLNEQIALRAGEVEPEELSPMTPDGEQADREVPQHG